MASVFSMKDAYLTRSFIPLHSIIFAFWQVLEKQKNWPITIYPRQDTGQQGIWPSLTMRKMWSAATASCISFRSILFMCICVLCVSCLLRHYGTSTLPLREVQACQIACFSGSFFSFQAPFFGPQAWWKNRLCSSGSPCSWGHCSLKKAPLKNTFGSLFLHLYYWHSNPTYFFA